jgi:uncharacterized membrane protein YvbJ
MEWGSDVMLFVIPIGIISFLLILLILFYILKNGTNKLESIKSSDQQIVQTELSSNQHLDEIKFCPDCGAKFETTDMMYCPTCGNKVP